MSSYFNPRCHVGETHGIYTIVDMLDEKDKYGHWIYKGVCNECGYIKYSHYGDFSGELSATTTCKHIGINGDYIKNTDWSNSRIRRIFRGMKDRCYNKNDKAYRWYGAKGIKIYYEWLNNPKLFEEWALSNGYSDSLTIDRIDEDKDYCPENCRWITLNNNTKYKSTTNLFNVDGIEHTGRDWARVLELGENTINTMLRKYPEDQVREFIRVRQKDKTKHRKSNQTWMNVYGLE